MCKTNYLELYIWSNNNSPSGLELFLSMTNTTTIPIVTAVRATNRKIKLFSNVVRPFLDVICPDVPEGSSARNRLMRTSAKAD